MASHDGRRAVSLIVHLLTNSQLIDVSRDRIADAVRKQLGMNEDTLSLAQILEGATWKGGREIAKQKRPETGGPPIEIESDGTLF